MRPLLCGSSNESLTLFQLTSCTWAPAGMDSAPWVEANVPVKGRPLTELGALPHHSSRPRLKTACKPHVHGRNNSAHAVTMPTGALVVGCCQQHRQSFSRTHSASMLPTTCVACTRLGAPHKVAACTSIPHKQQPCGSTTTAQPSRARTDANKPVAAAVTASMKCCAAKTPPPFTRHASSSTSHSRSGTAMAWRPLPQRRQHSLPPPQGRRSSCSRRRLAPQR